MGNTESVAVEEFGNLSGRQTVDIEQQEADSIGQVVTDADQLHVVHLAQSLDQAVQQSFEV